MRSLVLRPGCYACIRCRRTFDNLTLAAAAWGVPLLEATRRLEAELFHIGS
jgi:hypothetical protein